MSTEPTPQSNIETLKVLIQQKSKDYKQQAQLISDIISSENWNSLDDEDKSSIPFIFGYLLNSNNETSQKIENGLRDNERIAAELYSRLISDDIWRTLQENDRQAIFESVNTHTNSKNIIQFARSNIKNNPSKPQITKPITWKEWFSKWLRIIGMVLLIISAFLTPLVSKAAFLASIIAGAGATLFVIGDYFLTSPKDWGKQISPTGNKIIFYLLALTLMALGAMVIGNLLHSSSVLDFVSQDSFGGLIPAVVFGLSFIVAGLRLFVSNWAGTNAYEGSLVSKHAQASAPENVLSSSFHPSNTASAPSSSLESSAGHPALIQPSESPSAAVSSTPTISSRS